MLSHDFLQIYALSLWGSKTKFLLIYQLPGLRVLLGPTSTPCPCQKNNLIYLFIFGCVGSSLLCRLSLPAESRGYSSCSAWAAHCGDSRFVGFGGCGSSLDGSVGVHAKTDNDKIAQSIIANKELKNFFIFTPLRE